MSAVGRRNSAFDRGRWVFVEDSEDVWKPAQVVTSPPGGIATMRFEGKNNLKTMGS